MKTLNMIEIFLDPGKLMNYAKVGSLLARGTTDYGYIIHAWLRACLGGSTIQPFRLFAGDTVRPLRLLGYTALSRSDLERTVATCAAPGAAGLWDWGNCAIKTMPSNWEEGARLGFELLAAPTSRKKGVEKDCFLHRVEGGETGGREAAYREWLDRRVDDILSLESVAVRSFRLVRRQRRSAGNGSYRPFRVITLPEVLFEGVLTVRRPSAFQELLERGIGRHRAFGYGMLLLKPLL